jgi:hypothetical protein
MKFITKIGVACTTIAMMASTFSYAGTVTSEVLLDNYIGADRDEVSTVDSYGGDDYDIHSMQVSRTIDGNSGELSVTIDSNFISFNPTKSGIKLGDLFIMDIDNYNPATACDDGSGNVGCNENNKMNEGDTVKSQNVWEYAFDLGGNRNGLQGDGVNITGDLRDLSTGSVAYSDDIITTYKDHHRGWQAIMVQNTPDSVDDSGIWSTNGNLLTMTFDISNTSLMGAAQLALRWQMTCANDIIEVVTNFTTSGGGGGGSTPVPEPSTLLLMLLAGFGLLASKHKKDSKFKA